MRPRVPGEKPGQTLQATALDHKEYLRMIGPEELRWQSRTHFFATADGVVRRILLNRARDKWRLERGGGGQRFDLTQIDSAFDAVTREVIYGPEQSTSLSNLYTSPDVAAGHTCLTDRKGTTLVVRSGDQLTIVAKNTPRQRL